MKLRTLIPILCVLCASLVRAADVPVIDANGNLLPAHGGPAHDKAITLPSDAKISGQSTGIQSQINANGAAISTNTSAIAANTTAINARVVITSNLASLRALGAQANGVQVAEAGYTTPGDGGGGLWYYDTSSTATENVGTIVKPTGVSGAGRFIREVQGQPYNVKWFGAKGDGVTDDGPAIQSDIDAVYAIGSGAVFVPQGTFILNTVTAPYYLLTIRDKVSVGGVGPSSILKAGPGLRNSTTGLAILYNHTDYVSDLTISDLTIDYNGQNNLVLSSYGSNAHINRTGGNIASGVMIRNVAFKNSAGHHFIWFGLNSADSRNTKNSIVGCSFSESGLSIAGNQTTDHSSIYMGSTNSVVANNSFVNTTQDYVGTAIELHSDGTAATGNTVVKYDHGVNLGGDSNTVNNVTISGNAFKSVVRGVVLWTLSNYTIDNLIVSNNTISVADNEGTAYAAGAGVVYAGNFDTSTSTSSMWTISGNDIEAENVNTSSFDYTITGIDINAVAGLSITGNTISGLKGEGIRLEAVAGKAHSDVIIANNTIRSCGYTSHAGRNRGISLATNASTNLATNVAVRSNVITAGHVGSSNDMDYGLSLNSTGQFERLSIEGNQIRGAVVFDMLTPTNQTTTTRPFISHVAEKTGTPFGVIRSGWASRWIDSYTGYIYDYRNASGTNGSTDGWNATVSVTGPPASTAPYNTQTWKKGDRFIAASGAVAVGSPKSWICTAGGTPGTITSEGNLGTAADTSSANSWTALQTFSAGLNVNGTAGVNIRLRNTSPDTSFSAYYLDNDGHAKLSVRTGAGVSKWELGHKGASNNYDFAIANDTTGENNLTINNTTGNVTWFQTNTVTSGTNNNFSITPTYNQASATTTNNDFVVDRTETAIGSGAQNLLWLGVGHVAKFTVDRTGAMTAGAVPFANVTGTANAVTNAMLAQVGANTIKGNNTGSTANASDLTVAQIKTMLGLPATADVQVFTANGTWTKPTSGSVVTVQMIGGGGGGGSGAVEASGVASTGGGGGSGGGLNRATFAIATLGGTEAVTVGAGGTGGAAQAGTSAAGNVGGAGGQSSFGNWLRTGGGTTGGAGGAAVAAGGGSAAICSISGSTSGGGSSATGAAGSNSTASAATSGGGGGGGVSTGATASAGGAGSSSGNNITGGNGGTAGGGNGASTSQTVVAAIGGPGGGGGGGNAAGNGGTGAAGSNYGGGGGGGGAALNGSSSGAGGAGAPGIVVVVSQ
jgi:hypothetical protein